MQWQKQLAELFTFLTLTGCAPVAVGAGTGAECALLARRALRHQRYALIGERARAPGRSSAGRSHGARAAQGVACGTGSVFPGV